ncbi:MAG: DUF4397 domain-containing protein [Calditrichia bacterium]
MLGNRFVFMFVSLLLGFTLAAQAQQTARLQVIHNAADPAAEIVDVYLWNGTSDTLLVKLDDFSFRSATPFVDVPAGDSLSVIIAGPGSTDPTSEVVTTIPVGALAVDMSYVAMANGVLNPADFALNPEARSIGFTLFARDGVREAGMNASDVDFIVFHGATDAPAVDVLARGVAALVDDAAYGDFTSYISVPAGAYTLDITPASDNSTIVASFNADLSGLGGGAAVVFASGFLTPSSNQGGPAFGLFAALPDGQVAEFGSPTSIIDDGTAVVTNYALEQNYPNPFNPTTSISFQLPASSFVTLKVYNVIGQEIATLLNKNIPAGRHSVNFDASNLVSGMYFYKIETQSFKDVRKMMLTK